MNKLSCRFRFPFRCHKRSVANRLSMFTMANCAAPSSCMKVPLIGALPFLLLPLRAAVMAQPAARICASPRCMPCSVRRRQRLCLAGIIRRTDGGGLQLFSPKLPVEVRNDECAVRRLLDFVQVIRVVLDRKEFTASEHFFQFSNTRAVRIDLNLSDSLFLSHSCSI